MVRTHYEILKITRDAPLEVVRAAYRALTLKYHPDRHAADAQAGVDATEMMALLNSAYDVLSDPIKRQEYDEWIVGLELRPARSRSQKRSPRPDWISAPGAGDAAFSSRLLLAFGRFRHYWVFYLFALAAIFLGSLWYERLYLHRSKALTPLASAMSAAREDPGPPREPSLFARPPERKPVETHEPPALPPETERPVTPARPPAHPGHAAAKPVPPREPAPEREAPKPVAKEPAPRVQKKVVEPQEPAQSAAAGEAYTRPATAPNGEAWPPSSDYVAGYLQRNTNGLSQVVIDNSKNNSDTYVKIVSVGDAEPKVVRNIFILAGDRFTAGSFKAGTYELHYQNLESGTLIRSETFALEESAISSGTRYSTVTLTLRAQPDESMNSFALSRDQF
jgi:curved DNA-binding protein CbpA